MQSTSEDISKIFPGPILVLAGPGTGKTHTLARRIKFLIEEKNVDPDQIAVITFTNEAAVNMKGRIRDMEKQDVYLPPEKHPHLICTMHKLGQIIISENSSKIPLDEDFKLVTSIALKRILLEDSAQLINSTREKSRETEECRQKGKCEESDKSCKCKICKKYKELLRSNNALDHDDQIMLATALLRRHDDILEVYRKKVRYLLVDEYQDINNAQFELIKLLTSQQEDGLFCVGDDDQSIYSFRGGSPEYIKQFEKDFSSPKIKSLTVSRRCPPEIFNEAIKVVEKFNRDRRPKPISEFVNTNGKIILYDVPSQNKEAQMIIRIVKDAIPYKDVLILVPHQGFAEPIKRALRQARINYQTKVDVDSFKINLLDVLKTWIENKTDNFATRQCVQEIILIFRPPKFAQKQRSKKGAIFSRRLVCVGTKL
jgi:DNA helicase-2/ATP-dependent DNA helicase PcrA